MEIKKGKLLYDGREKKLYFTDRPDHLILHFKDGYSVGNESKTVRNKGTHCNAIAETLFKFLESYHVRTHYAGRVKPNEMLIRACGVIPIDVQVWNFAVKDLARRYRRKNNTPLDYTVVEYYLKDEAKHPMINIDHACAFGYATPDEMEILDRTVRKANAVLKSYFDRRDLKLAQFHMEFGRFEEELLMVDALTPDNFTLLDSSSDDKSISDPLESEDLEAAFEDLKRRLC